MVTLSSERKISDLPMRLNNYEFKADFYVVNMGEIDVVLGMAWLHAIGEFTLNLRNMEMKVKVNGKPHVLKAIRDNNLRVISFRWMERLIRHDMVDWTVECMLMLAQQEQQKIDYHLDIQELRIKHSKVFSDIPQVDLQTGY